MISVHGRTRVQGYGGAAEYDTIAAVKAAVRVPVVANGDIDSPAKAREVLERTGADALMIGRAAQGRPWIFREIGHYLATGQSLPPPRHRGRCGLAARTPARSLWPVRRVRRRAQRAQAHRLGGACAARRRGVSRGDEHARQLRGTGRRRRAVLRPPGRPPHAVAGRRRVGQRPQLARGRMSAALGRPRQASAPAAGRRRFAGGAGRPR